MNIICTDKSKFDIDEAKIKLKKWLGQNHYYYGREWAYKNIKPKIICEKYMVDGITNDLIDYKFYCFNGVPKFLYVAKGGAFDLKNLLMNFLDLNWEKTEFQRTDHKQFENLPDKPQQLKKMILFAGVLSKNIPFSRIDFYVVNGTLYFSEITLYPAGGYAKFEPYKYEVLFGDWINLPEKHKSRE